MLKTRTGRTALLRARRETPSAAPPVIGLRALLAEFDRFTAPIPLETLLHAFRRLRITPADVRRWTLFGDTCYRRNPVHAGRAYEALVLCWRSGQRSPIHDHTGSACGVRVIAGQASETLYSHSPSGLIYPLFTQTHGPGAVTASLDSDMHQVGNLQPAGEDLITLHVYSPPLTRMRVYFLADSAIGAGPRAVRAASRTSAEPRPATPATARRRRS
jgi:cysteine dioxygenase